MLLFISLSHCSGMGRAESIHTCWLFAPVHTRRSSNCYLPSPLAAAAAFNTAVGLLQAMQHLMQRSMSAAFNSWRLVAQEMRQHGHNLVLAVTRWQHSYMSSAFYTWLDWIQERHARYTSLLSKNEALLLICCTAATCLHLSLLLCRIPCCAIKRDLSTQ